MWDNIFFMKMAQVLKTKILNAQINNVFVISRKVILHLYKEQSFYLIFSFSPYYFTIQDTLVNKQSYLTHFTRLMKTHLKGQTISEVIISESDRQFEIKTSKNNYLIHEKLGKDSNLILTKQDKTILGSYINKKYNETTKRSLIPNYSYQKVIPLIVASTLEERLLEVSKLSVSLNKIMKQKNTYMTTKEIVEELKQSKSLYFNNGLIHFLKLSEQEKALDPFDFLNNYYKDESLTFNTDLYDLLSKTKEDTLNHLNKKLIKQEKLLRTYHTYPSLIERGNLILTYNMPTLTHDDFNNFGANYAKKNAVYMEANTYFKLAHKYRLAIEPQKQYIKELKKEIENLKQIMIKKDNKIINEVNETFLKLGYLKNSSRHKKEKVPFIRYKINGHLVSVGKNATQNDQLTFKYANKNDYFFHVADAPGSHTILHTDKIDNDLLLKVAKIALKHSKIKNDPTAVVHYCQVRYVKKLRDAKKGQVNIRNYKNLTVIND